MNEKMYKASDVVGILLEEITNAEFLRVTKRLSDIPSAVVRCKDCKHYTKSRLSTDVDGNVIYHCKELNQFTFPNFYCASAERTEEDDKPTANENVDHWGYPRLFCPECGVQYIKGQPYCVNCGHKLI